MTNRVLKLAPALSLPLAVVTQKLAWLGVTGSGKTYGASKLVELLLHAGAQVVVLDPVGVWYGLRLAKGGKNPSNITIPIFGGLHGDVPLEPTAGALVANLIVDKTLSAVLDVSQFESDTDKARFAKDFADRFFFRKKAAPSAVHLVLEECQEFVPQNPQRGEEHMLHAFVRLQKLGRNFGIGSSYVSQRPQEVNKKALNMAQTLFVFRTTGSHERDAIEKWIKDKALDEDIAGDLPKIPTGQCHVWSPEFLRISETVAIAEKETFNASATPEVGAAAVTRELAPIDLAKVAKDMAATIEKAKADDPRELRKRIRQLEDQVAGKAMTAVAVHLQKQKPLLTDGDRALLEKLRTRLDDIGQVLLEGTTVIADRLAGFMRDEAQKAIAAIEDKHAKARAQYAALIDGKGFQKMLAKLTAANPPDPAHRGIPSRPERIREEGTPTSPEPRTPRQAISDVGEISPAELRMLDVVAAWHPDGLLRLDLAIRSGYAHGGGGFRNTLSALHTAGLIGKADSRVILSAEAERKYRTRPPRQRAGDVQDIWRGKLSPAEWKLLSALIEVYPAALSRTELAARTAYEVNGGGFRNTLSAVNVNGLIEKRGSELRAVEILCQ